jgi:hypothetical protein
MAKPDFFIVGNPKSGTTALYHFLSVHPQLFMCKPKEPFYFAKDLCKNPDPDGIFHQLTEEQYLALFEEAETSQLCGEASAVYLYSRVAAEEIAAFNPEAKIIAFLREPIDFLHSFYMQLKRSPIAAGENARSFATALRLEKYRRQGRRIPRGCAVPELLYYRDWIKYAKNIGRYLKVFPRDRVRVFLYDDFRESNQNVYREMLEFLGVDPEFTPEFATHHRGGWAPRSRILKAAAEEVLLGSGWTTRLRHLLKSAAPSAARTRIRQYVLKDLVRIRTSTPRDALRSELGGEFYSEVELAAEMVGRDLVRLWGYDRYAAPTKMRVKRLR